MDAAEVLAQLRSDAGLREMARALLLGDELLELPEAVARLIDGQAALERSVARLIDGQAALERSVARLIDGQAALERSVARLTDGQARLFEGQAALEQRVSSLEKGQEALRKEVGSLSRTIGGTAEEDAVNMVEYVMGLRGYRLLGEPTTLDLDGDGELDVAARVEDAAGHQLSVLVEAKVRLRAREVRRWAEQVSDPDFQRFLAAAGLPGPYLVYGYGIRVYPDAKEAARLLGIGVISSRGEDVSTEPRAA